MNPKLLRNITPDYQLRIRNLMLLLLLLEFLCISGCGKNIVIPDSKYNSQSYSMFGRNASRVFYIPENLGDSLELKWDGDINGSFATTSVTAYDNYVFVPDLSGRVYAFDIRDGKEFGYIKYKGAISPAPMINQFVMTFVVTEYKETNSVIYNYNFHTGQETKKMETEGKVQSEPLMLNDGFILLTEQGKAIKYGNDYNKLWEFDTKSYIHSSPALYKDYLVFGNDKGDVFSIDARQGSLNYKKNVGTGFEGGFSISGDTVYTADDSGVIYCLSISSGKVIWQYRTGTKINVFPVFDDNFLYMGNLRGEIFKLDKKNGMLKWKISTDGIINTTPLLFNDYLVQPDLNKKIYLINTGSGKIAKTLNFEGRTKLSPVYYNNTLFFGVDNGRVLAYEIIK